MERYEGSSERSKFREDVAFVGSPEFFEIVEDLFKDGFFSGPFP